MDRRARGTEFVQLGIRRLANSPETTKMDFWSINPYVGCEFGCSYCYARGTHKWTVDRHGMAGGSWSGEDFEHRIFVKRSAGRVLLQTLDPQAIGSSAIVIGTATDPYQPAERRFRITREVLTSLLDYRGFDLHLISKSPLITRDVDLLTALQQRHKLTINVSIISLDPWMVRRFEPKTPLPHARIRGLRTLAAAGIHAGLLIAPILPGITDTVENLEPLIAAGKEAGAGFVIGSALRLGEIARAGFLPVLEREYPELLHRYLLKYRERITAGPDYLAALARRFRSLSDKYGLTPVDERYRTAHQNEIPSRNRSEEALSLFAEKPSAS